MLRALTLILLAALALPARGQGLEMASQVDGLQAVALSRLPANPAGPITADCPVLLASPSTPEGRAIAALGWGVTGEVAWKGYRLVSFAGRATQGTSGTCLLQDGNLAILQNGALLGLVYADTGATRGPGRIEITGDNLRLWDGEYILRPLADVRLDGDGMAILSHPASRDSFCAGGVSLPSLYGLPITLASRLIRAEGWEPSPTTDALRAGEDFGLPEAQGCSGTGYNFCTFDWHREDGATLTAITAGDGLAPGVVRYDAGCAKG